MTDDELPEEFKVEWQKSHAALDKLREVAPAGATSSIKKAEAELGEAKRRAKRAHEIRKRNLPDDE